MTRMAPSLLLCTLSTFAACVAPTGPDAAQGQHAAALDQAMFVIDDFTTGFDSLSLVSGSSSRLQPGAMLGELRNVYFSVDADPLQQATSYTMNGAGGLVISSGLNSYWGAYLMYGYDMDFQIGSVSLALAPYDQACLEFGSNDHPVSGGFQFFQDGAYATASWYAEPHAGPFSVPVPFDSFATTSGEPLPWDHVSFVTVLLQTGSASAGNDLELRALKLGPCAN